MPGTLFVVSTPIGNLGDLTARAADVLRTADVVLCEDTRHSRRLLDHVGSRAPTSSVHEHNEARRAAELVARLVAGETFALVSDAGTPLLSDPGARLVAAAAAAEVPIVPVPGASALLAALVASALDVTRFTYFGFLARKGRERRETIAELAALRHSAVLYEAPGRVGDTLAELAEACGADRRAVVARELTKQFEEVRRGTLGALAAYYADAAPRGEVVLVIGGPTGDQAVTNANQARARASAWRAAGLSAREVARRLSAELGVPRNEAYRISQASDAGAAGAADEEEEDVR